MTMTHQEVTVIMQRKAQAAMEFLMTYGWAILVVLAAIGALAYFGVLSPGQFAQERCTIGSNFDCTDNVIEGDSTVRFAVTNLHQGAISNVNVSVAGDCTSTDTGVVGPLAAREGSEWLSFTCDETFQAGELYNIDIEVSYQLASDEFATRTASGSMVARP